MKKRILSIVLCLVMVFSLLPFTASAASAIPINEETFPDPVFREYVLKIVGSSVLTDTIARQIEVLDVSDDNIKEVLGDRAPITSLLGIRYLRYVKDLNCSGQELKKTLNLEQNSRVEKLDCRANQLTDLRLDPRGNSLRYLDCSGNNLTALDLRSNKKLQALQCQNNRLSWLDLSSNTALDPTKVDCSGNVYDIEVDRNLQYKVYPDLPCYGATEGTYFTAARASDWAGGTVSKVDAWDVLTLDNARVKEVTYKYDTGNAEIGRVAFTLKTAVPAAYVINSAALTVQSPVEDESAANPTVTTDSGAKYVVESADWRVSSSMTPYTGAFEKGKSYTLNLLLAPKSGYHFADSESIQVTVNGKAADKVYPYKDGKLIVTATFTVENFITISLDPNGGTGTMQPMRVKAGVGYTLPECTFTPPEGKEFAGWLAKNGEVYPAGNVVTSSIDQSFKATWKDKEVAEVTISFDPNGGTGTMQPMRVKAGVDFTLPECTFTPPAGKEFAGWLAANGEVYPAGDNVVSSTDSVLKATWKDKAEVDVTQMFTDVTKNWAYPGIQYCVTHGIMGGMGNGTFAPTGTTTRAQIVQILYNLEGTPAVSGTTPFTDLTANWYKPAILWAYQNNVVAGTSPTTFDPERPVTREQIAVILTQYMFNVLKMNRTWTPADLSAFPDGANVSSWAKEAMQDAVALGLINGTKAPDGLVYLDPQGSATRQQVATILMNFCQNVKK